MPNTTTRAYTLKLQGDRLALWRSHVVFNRGVRAWGEWLLSLRGGLPASLADHKELLAVEKKTVAQAVKDWAALITAAAVRQEPKFEAATDKKVREEVAARKKRITEAAVAKELLAARRSELRRTLALSWLCPETPVQLLPQAAVVAAADDSDRERKVLDRFRQILRDKGVADVAGWVQDCDATLRAAIRSDAVWVDRTACFRAMPTRIRPSEIDAAKHLFRLIGSASDYFAMPSSESAAAEPKDFASTCRDWVSTFWGGGEKANKAKILAALSAIGRIKPARVVGKRGPAVLAVIAGVLRQKPVDDSVEALARAIGWLTGRPSASRLAIDAIATSPRVTQKLWDRLVLACDKDCNRQKSKLAFEGSASAIAAALEPYMAGLTGMPYAATGRELIGEYATMLAFAMRRVSQIHTKAKQAEAERQSFGSEQRRIALVPSAARKWLEAYVEARTAASGAVDGYQLRRRALGGWPEVVAAWASCQTAEDRVTAVRELQADWDKPGDVQLFESLATDHAVCVWKPNGVTADPSVLTDFVRAAVADQNAVRFKVPAYRHPDPLRSPTFIGFGNSQWSIDYSAQAEAKGRKKHLERAAGPKAAAAKEALERAPVLQQVRLGLWSGDSLQPAEYRWQSQRLLRDLALQSIQNLEGTKVTRASRLGRSHAPSGPVQLDGITDDAPWNGRLQAPRRQLEDLARVLDARNLPYDDESKWPLKVRSRLKHLEWFLTHSAKLTPSGPWLDYVAGGLANDWQWAEGREGAYLFREDNKGRKGRAKLILSRLPGLRVLSIDLGLRTSAAAAVWQVVSKRELTTAKAAGESVKETDLHCFVHSGERTLIFRRVGPSAWARLDRQFLIRLDGERRAARPATNAEWEALQGLRAWLGCGVELKPRQLPPVDRLQQAAERLCRLGLRRLSDLARAAFLLTAKERPIMGGRMEGLDDEGRIQAAQDSLVIWHSLASSDEFANAQLKALWQMEVGDDLPLVAGLTKKQQQDIRDSLRSAAERLNGNMVLGRQLTAMWKERSDEWARHLRWLRDWVIPRFDKRTKGERVRSARDVGGLSLERIATIRGVYQVMRAYASRPEPTNLRAGVERLEAAIVKKLRPEFGRRMLAKMELLRENRVKQIASRIVEAALGVGSEDRLHWDKGRKRPTAVIADPRFTPCHAVVIENLESYRPDDKRTRRENRGLMSWAARAVQKYLAEGCELHGLYLRQVSPSYTSRQDSRTGSPGLRCNDVPVQELTNAQGWIARLITRAEEAVKNGKATPRQRLLIMLAEAVQRGDVTSSAVRLIAPGGQLFVAANGDSPAAKGIHADMNAAANIGLVALLDPDWPAAWWRLPCKAATGEVDDTTISGSEAVPAGRAILEVGERVGKGIVNAWSDPSDAAVSRRLWTDTRNYWREVEERVVEILLAWNLGGRRGRGGALPF